MMSSDDSGRQLDEITRTIVAMARLDFSTEPPVFGTGPLDAVAVGLQALGEELQASVVAREEAEAANEAKSAFLANMSHELRTPLMTLLGNAELLLGESLTHRQYACLQNIRRAGQLLERLINDVLDVSKIAAGTFRIENKAFSLGDMLKRIAQTHCQEAELKGLVFRTDLQGIPEEPVLGDRDRLEQVLHNLVGNAIKFTPSGTVDLCVRAESLPVGFHVEFGVEDTGIGIPEALQEQIFERFVSGDLSIRRQHNGAGLGLSIARSLVTEMGGGLSLHSVPGDGSRFTFGLLLKPSAAALPEGQTVSPTSIPARVLVVDDNDLVRGTTLAMLEEIGCNPQAAASGKEAVEVLGNEDFDLILMDCQMPGLDGIQTTTRLLQRYPQRSFNIVAITAHSTPEDEQRSLDAGMRGHLNKPFTMGQLRSVLERLQ